MVHNPTAMPARWPHPARWFPDWRDGRLQWRIYRPEIAPANYSPPHRHRFLVANRLATVGAQDLQQIIDLKTNALQRRSGDVRRLVPRVIPKIAPRRMRVPVRRTEAGKRGNEVNAAVIGNTTGKLFASPLLARTTSQAIA